MLEFVKKAGMMGSSPTVYTAQYIQMRKKDKGVKPGIELRIRPRSLLCTANPEDDYGKSIHNQSNTWKFHRPRPKSYRYLQ